jgi:hypothetical protein
MNKYEQRQRHVRYLEDAVMASPGGLLLVCDKKETIYQIHLRGRQRNLWGWQLEEKKKDDGVPVVLSDEKTMYRGRAIKIQLNNGHKFWVLGDQSSFGMAQCAFREHQAAMDLRYAATK